jgi:hypothetical protein
MKETGKMVYKTGSSQLKIVTERLTLEICVMVNHMVNEFALALMVLSTKASGNMLNVQVMESILSQMVMFVKGSG